MTTPAAPSGNRKRQMKSASRLYAVQALYQMELSGQTAEKVTREFIDYRFGAEIETVKASRVDLSARPIGIWVGDPDIAEPTHTADSVIISTGARSLMLNLEAERR